jgi:hypothetical protein
MYIGIPLVCQQCIASVATEAGTHRSHRSKRAKIAEVMHSKRLDVTYTENNSGRCMNNATTIY